MTHRPLAGLARVGLLASLAGLVAAAGLLVVPPAHGGPIPVRALFDRWLVVPSAADAYREARMCVAVGVVTVGVPGGLLLAFGLLRLAATGSG